MDPQKIFQLCLQRNREVCVEIGEFFEENIEIVIESFEEIIEIEIEIEFFEEIIEIEIEIEFFEEEITEINSLTQNEIDEFFEEIFDKEKIEKHKVTLTQITI